MKSVFVSLPNPDVVQEFVEKLSFLEGNFDLISGSYILDARSLMGIFTLDLSEPLQLNIEKDTPENLEAMKKYLVLNAEQNTDGGK